jgi:hypothetical protein
MAIGLLLIGERFLPAGLPALVSAKLGWQIVAGIAIGLCIGTASTFLGVAGGELLIPTLIFVFGADIHTAGSAVLFISIPTVCMGLFRYSRIGLLPSRSTLLPSACLWELKALLVRQQAGCSPGQQRPAGRPTGAGGSPRPRPDCRRKSTRSRRRRLHNTPRPIRTPKLHLKILAKGSRGESTSRWS